MAIYGSYSEIYDMNTVDDNISALKFHTPQDGAPVQHLGGLFAQFRKYKYLGCEVAMIPAQQLPLDPLQVSSVDGDGLVDPRDVLNPILYKHWNGERTLLDNYLDSTFVEKIGGTMGIGGKANEDTACGQSIDEVSVPARTGGGPSINAEQFYAMQLMDNSFKVSHVQEPLRIKMRPMVWNLQAQRPITSYAPVSELAQDGTQDFSKHGIPEMMPTPSTEKLAAYKNVEHGRIPSYNPDTSSSGFDRYVNEQEFFTSGMKPMGWMPTNNTFAGRTSENSTGFHQGISTLAKIRLPKVYMHLMILPPAYKQNFYYRLVMKHKFLFKNMTSLKAIDAIDSAKWYNKTITFDGVSTMAKNRLNTLADATTYVEGNESSLETFNLDLKDMGGRFEFEEGVGENYDDGSDAKEMKSLEEQINDILDGRKQQENEE